jgi:hypothetical protein
VGGTINRRGSSVMHTITNIHRDRPASVIPDDIVAYFKAYGWLTTSMTSRLLAVGTVDDLRKAAA